MRTARRLLLVEDNPGDADMIEALLEAGGEPQHSFAVAVSMADATRQLQASAFDGVLLDLQLPDASGVDCVRRIRACAADIAIVVLTGNDDEQLALDCLDAGAQDYLTKAELQTQPLRRAIAYASARVRLRRTNEELEEQAAHMRALATRLNAVREEERTRISREVHDELGQLLTGVKMDLGWLGRRFRADTAPTPEVVLGKLVEAESLVDRITHGVQRIALEMRPSALDALGLPEALRDECRRFEARIGVPVEVHVAGNPRPDGEVSTAIFRVLQELLTNVARHARASHVRVVLEEDPEGVRLQVQDDGVGVPPDVQRRANALGLLGIRERAAALGGTLRLEGGPGAGTLASVHVPRTASAAGGAP